MVNVYAWPPVGVVACDWSLSAPVSRSRSLLTGRRYVSAAHRRRRVAALSVSALARGGYGAGYVKALERFLDGGVHLVRLSSMGINDRAPVEDSVRQGRRLIWRAGSGPGEMTWLAGSGPRRLTWFVGAALTATSQTAASAAVQSILVEGFPPDTVIAWPGEFVTIYVGGIAETHMVAAPARSSAAGNARIRLVTRPSGLGRVNVGTVETAVFEIVDFPRSPRPLGENWVFDFEFREIFADEVAGGFVEIDPWS